MELNLKRPLAFFDLETTGVNVSTDRIVEISILKVLPDGTEEALTLRVNPGRNIPKESSLFHGIYDEDVKDLPPFSERAQQVADFIGESDLAGYNSNKFDVPMLMEEFLRAGVLFSLKERSFIDVQNIFHQMEQRTLKAAYRFYCEKNLDNAHSAEADVRATYEVLKAQLVKYQDVDFEDKHGAISKPVVNDVQALHDFTNLSRPVDFAGRLVYDEEGDPIINFGKHRGKKVEEVFQTEPSYYAWMQNGEFPLYTKKVLEELWAAFREKRKVQAQESAKTGVERKKGIRPEGKRSTRSGPITDNMLKDLQDKFKK